MAYELLVLDLDGTLTNSEKKITSKTKDALMKLQESGKKVVLASGRPTPGILPLAKELELEKFGSYILSFNGAKIINCSTNEAVYEQFVDPMYIQELYDCAARNNVGISTYKDTTVISGFEKDKYIDLETSINKMDLLVVPNFVEYVDFPTNKIMLPGDPDILARIEIELKEKFGDVLNIFRSEPYFLEIMPPNIDKAFSLSKLLDTLNMTKDEMICCGDGYNDLTMIQYAGLGVAMANAQQVVLDASDYVTLSNDEDGIIPVIEKFMLS